MLLYPLGLLIQFYKYGYMSIKGRKAAKVNNYINNLFIKAIGNNTPGELIQVQFYGRSDLIEYPASMIDLLKRDKQVQNILDPSTGEILFTNDL